MTEHLTSRQIESYHRRVLDPAELIALDEHLNVCGECRKELNAVGQRDDKLNSLRKSLASAPTSKHLDREQLEAFADGSLELSEIEIVKDHLATCAECELLASDLVAFRDEVAPDLDREYAPESAPENDPGSAAILAAAGQHSSGRNLTSGQDARAPRRASRKKSLFAINSPAVAFGMGALAMLIVVSLVFLIVRATRTGPQVAQTPSPSPAASPANDSQTVPSSAPLPSPSPQVLLALNDGAKQIGIDDRGNLVGLDELPPAVKETVKSALITQQAANLATLSNVGSQPVVLRGGENQGPRFAPLSPMGKVLFSARPTLRWSKLDGATEYRVEIFDSNSVLAASSPPLTSNTWNLPNALERGEVYTWQVTATKEGEKIKAPLPPAPESKFKILDAKHADELTLARKNFAGSHLALGVLYAQSGLLDEAETEFSALAKANPQSEVALKLLKNLQAARK